jgi:hypothetical protein
LTGDFLTGGFSIDTGLGGLDSLGGGLFDDFLTGGFSVATFGSGGKVTGRGTGQSDSIPAYLSNGEYVMSNAAVSALGTPVLDALNKGDASALKQLCNCNDDGGGGFFDNLLGSGFLGIAGIALSGKKITPGGIMGSLGWGFGASALFGGGGPLHFADGGPVGYRSMMPRASSMRGYGRGGRSITIGDVHAPLIVNGEMDAKTMRKTQAQHSSNMRREVAEAVRKGLTQ